MALKLTTSSFPIRSIPRNSLKSPKFLVASTLHPCTMEEERLLKKPLIINHHQMEIFKSMEDWAEKNLLVHLKPVEKCWQPHDLLPDPASDGFQDHVRELKESAMEIPDEYFVVLVGDMITEEAISTYQTVLNSVDGVKDETGSSLSPWAKWNRGWTAEENRHGDLLNKYIYLSGRVDMRAVEKTIQYLIGSGMDIEIGNNAYNLYMYTSFQERATNISHCNTAKHAKHYGNTKLARICGTIAADEKRHEVAYTRIVKRLFELDPDGAVQAFATMMRRRITMPAHFLYDGSDPSLFDHFSAVAQRLGVYTARDYADILEFLVGMWDVGDLAGLSPEGRKAQDYVCELAPKIRRVEERAQQRAKRAPTIPFSWVHGREVQL